MKYIAQTVFTSNCLKHYGIKGQKWHVKNGPPYPLDITDYSVNEIRANQKYITNNRSSNQTVNQKKEL